MPSAAVSAAHATRAGVYRGLARLLAAGMPVDRALLTAAEGGSLEAAAARAASSVARGRSFPDASTAAGLLPISDTAVIAGADRAGALVVALDRLAARHEAADARGRRIRARLMMPIFVLAVGCLAAPVPAWFAGRIDVAGYLARALLPLALPGLLGWIGARVAARIAARGTGPAMGALLLGVPVLGALVRESARVDLLENLALLLAAGVPAAEALRTATAAIGNPALRPCWRAAAGRLERGEDVTASLTGAGVLRDEERALLGSAEVAGRLDEGLGRSAARARAALESNFDLVAEWIPRVVYALVVAIIAGGLLG